MSSPKATQLSDTKVPRKCHQWMIDLWDDLSARSTAYDARINSTNAKILRKDSASIQSNLQAKLSETTCTLASVAQNHTVVRRRSKAYQEKAASLRTNALFTIFEGNAVEPAIPKMPRLSDNKKLATWVDESVQVYGKLISSDSVDAAIKPRIRQIRQSLWTYQWKRKGSGTDDQGGRHVLSRSDCQCLSTEVAVMLAVTMRITKYTGLLDGHLVDADFRPRLLAILGHMKSFQEDHFLIGTDGLTTIAKFEKEVRDHLETRAQTERSLGLGSEP